MDGPTCCARTSSGSGRGFVVDVVTQAHLKDRVSFPCAYVDDEWFCRVSFGLTLYLPEPPTADQVERAWSAYCDVCPPERRRWIRNNRPDSLWERLDQDRSTGAPTIAEHLARFDRRLDYGIGVWDGQEDGCWSFRAHGVVFDDAAAASFVQVYFPDDIEPETIVALARRFASRVNFLSGHAGHANVFRVRHKSRAFDQTYAWAKRYLGLEVEDLNKTLPHVVDAVKGASWLTLIGRSFDRHLSHGQTQGPLPPQVTVHRETFGWVLRAGVEPTLADRNRREFPSLYAAVEHAIQPVKVTTHAEFEGRFGGEGATLSWLRRLTDPEGW